MCGLVPSVASASEFYLRFFETLKYKKRETPPIAAVAKSGRIVVRRKTRAFEVRPAMPPLALAKLANILA